jgi:thiol:disulfide interchange protein DsbA
MKDRHLQELSMRKIVFCVICGIVSLALLSGVVQAQTGSSVKYQEGLHYTLIEDAPLNNNAPMELVEAFSYLCTHCNTFEPYISGWTKRKPDYVAFSRIPIVFGRKAWEIYARGYVTAEMMGIVDEAHQAMMDTIWKEKAVMRSMEELAEFYARFGVTAESFLNTSKSFAVDAKMRKDQRLAQEYGIRGTPAMVLNGRYMIAGSEAVASYDVMLDVVDYLIAMDTAERAKNGSAEVQETVAETPSEAAEET